VILSGEILARETFTNFENFGLFRIPNLEGQKEC